MISPEIGVTPSFTGDFMQPKSSISGQGNLFRSRMDQILHPDTYALWLTHNMHNSEQLKPLFRPFPSGGIAAHKVPDLVNNPRFDSPACIKQV